MMLFNVIKALFILLFRIKVKGDLNQLKQQRLIITSNHLSFLDGLIIALFLPIRPAFAIYTHYIDHKLIRFAARYVDFFPMDPLNPMSLKRLFQQVKQGQPIVIFPEGRITVTGSLMKIYDGAGYIAAKTETKIIPIWLEGAEFSYFGRLRKLFKVRFFPKITLTVLPAETITIPSNLRAKERHRIAGEKLKQIMINARFNSQKPTTLFAALLNAQKRYGFRKKCMKDTTLVLDSYFSLLKKILAVSCLVEKITKKRQRIGLLLPNATMTVATFFALLLKSRVPAMLNYTAGINGIRCVLTAANITTIITSRTFLEKGQLLYLVDELKEVNWYFLEDLKDRMTWSNRVWIIIHLVFTKRVVAEQYPDEEALILFTSGSEGTPKGVVHSHASLLANVEQIRSVIALTPADCFMATLPLFHAFGLTAGLLVPLFSGCRIFLYPNPLHYRLIPDIIYNENCTVLFGTPTFLNYYARFAQQADFLRLRYVLSGAEKLSKTIVDNWMDKFGLRVFEGYGVTECAPVIAINVPGAYKSNTVGQIIPGMTARVIPVAGITEGGRLQLKGSNIMKGYFRVENPGQLEPPAAANETGNIESGWYDTGDIVTIDSEGYCTIKGRLKRFAKIAGEMVSLESVEELVKRIDDTAQHGVTVKTDSQRGEALVLFTTSSQITAEALNKMARQIGLPMLSVPKDIRVIHSLPLLGSGKVDFVALAKMV